MKCDSTRDIKNLTILQNNSTHTHGNWDEIDQFFVEQELLQVTQYEIRNLNSPVSILEIEFIIKIPSREFQHLDDFIGEFYQVFKIELTSVVNNVLEKEEGTLPNSFWGYSYPATKTRWNTVRKESYILINIPHEYRCKNP